MNIDNLMALVSKPIRMIHHFDKEKALWTFSHGIDVTITEFVTTSQIAQLAATSQDRVREVYAVLLQVAKVKRATRASEVQMQAAA